MLTRVLAAFGDRVVSRITRLNVHGLLLALRAFDVNPIWPGGEIEPTALLPADFKSVFYGPCRSGASTTCSQTAHANFGRT